MDMPYPCRKSPHLACSQDPARIFPRKGSDPLPVALLIGLSSGRYPSKLDLFTYHLHISNLSELPHFFPILNSTGKSMPTLLADNLTLSSSSMPMPGLYR